MAISRKIVADDFEYCECGCKGYVWEDYWCYYDLKTTFSLYKGHGFTFGTFIKRFTSLDDARKEVRKLLNIEN